MKKSPKNKTTVISFNKVSKEFTLQKDKKLKRDLLNPFRKQVKGSVRVLHNATFKIRSGETVGLIGPNGSGKTTLLRLMAGILTPTFGTIEIVGRVAPLIELGSGFHQELSGKENIYLNGAILGMTFKEVDSLLPSIIQRAGKTVAKFIDEPLKHYSMGMKARLGFSIAIHTDPDILLIDESLSVGDIDFIEESLEKIKELQKKGKTIVMTSHNAAIIDLICTRTIRVENGKVEI